MASEDPDFLKSIEPFINEYYNGLKQYNLRNWVFDSQMHDKKTMAVDIVRYLVFLPFFIIASAFHILPYLIFNYIGKTAKDVQFQSSLKFVAGTFLFPFYYLLFFAFPIPLFAKIIFLLPMPVLGILSFDYFIVLKKQWAKFRYFKLLKGKNAKLNSLVEIRNRIFRTLDELFL